MFKKSCYIVWYTVNTKKSFETCLELQSYAHESEDYFISDYANQKVLVSTEWVNTHLDDPDIVVVEVDVDTKAYQEGHIPGAVGWNWQSQLCDPIQRDIIKKSDLEKLLSNSSGHIPTAKNIGWQRACNEDGTFKSYEELKALYTGEGVTLDKGVIAYCRIGERSSHTWFVLKYLLGYPAVKNYDGSWTEWGNLVGAPIER